MTKHILKPRDVALLRAGRAILASYWTWMAGTKTAAPHRTAIGKLTDRQKRRLRTMLAGLALELDDAIDHSRDRCVAP